MPTKIFPTPSSIVTRHNTGGQKFRKLTKRLNRVVSFLYRMKILPLFGAGKSLIIIEHFGRKTGKRRYNPTLCYTFYTGVPTVYVAKGKKADWIRNILAMENQTCHIYKGFKKLKVKIEFIEEEEERNKHLVHFCQNYNSAKGVFGFNKETDMKYLDTDGFRNILSYIEFIQLEII